MKKIENPIQLENILKKYKFNTIFGKKYDFELIQFNKNEYINSSLNPRDYLLFSIAGSTSIFNLHEDGSYYLIGRSSKFGILGDMEYALPESHQFRIFCNTDVLCIGLEIASNKKELDEDTIFLRYIMHSLAEKVDQFSLEHAEPVNLKERVLFYMRNHDNKIHGVEHCADSVHCSRRQLQRILVELINENKIIKLCKGNYEIRL